MADEIETEVQQPQPPEGDTAEQQEPQEEPEAAADTEEEPGLPEKRKRAPRGAPADAEAARRRRETLELKETLAAREQQIAELQAYVIDSMVAPVLRDVDDFNLRYQRSEFLDEAGRIDRGKIRDALQQLVKERPELVSEEVRASRRPRGRQEPALGLSRDELAARRRQEILDRHFPEVKVTASDLLARDGEAYQTLAAREGSAKIRVSKEEPE